MVECRDKRGAVPSVSHPIDVRSERNRCRSDEQRKMCGFCRSYTKTSR
jgi:hypothetical protein